MRPIQATPALLLSLCAALACATPTENGSPQEQQAFSIFDGLRLEMTAQHAQGHADQLANLFLEDGEILLPLDDSMIRGREAIRSRYETLFGAYAVELSLTPGDSRIVDAQDAFEEGEFALTLRPHAGGAEPLEFTGTYELKGKLGAGGLKIGSFTFTGAG
jgi:hypothetical protein